MGNVSEANLQSTPARKYSLRITFNARSDIYCHTKKQLSGQGIGIKMFPPIYRSLCLSEQFNQALILQNLPSILVGHALDVSESHTILDMCAMPGGKTTHIASLTNYKANIG
jgi:16S rRNA C967 or C1407 C5-methylase (RsmB/RsmF family)